MAAITSDVGVDTADRVRGGLDLAFVVLAVAQVVLVVAQGLTAGHVLTGNRGFVLPHEVVGANVIGFVSIAQIVVAGLLRRRGRASTPVVVVTVVAFLLVVVQVYSGFDSRFALHVPNALLVLGAQFAMLWLARRP